MKPSADASAPGQAKRSNATSRKAIPAPEPTPIGPLPPCAQGHEPKHLKTGDRIEPDGRKSGESNIQVMNRSNLDAVVRLVDNSTSKTSRFVYVQAGHSFALGDIEAGTYWVRFEFGSDWMPECRDFMRDSAYREFASPLVFVDDRVRLYQVTLSPVVGGRAAAKKVDRQRFLEGD